MRHDTFRRLLARSAGPRADSPAIAAATRYLCEHFARQLSPIIGDAGVAAIFGRSLDLTGLRFAPPAPEAAPQDDPPGEGPFAPVERFVRQHEPGTAGEAGVAVLLAACDLLASLIGESLTTRLLQRAWPEDFTAGREEPA